MAQKNAHHDLRFMQGGGMAGAQMRSINWSLTPLGDPTSWPECICTIIGICLNSSFPMSVYVGDDYYLFYNEAYIAIAGDRHPDIMGKTRQEAWPEVWEQLKPQFDAVYYYGESFRKQDRMIMIKRYGIMEECYFDYTLSPVANADGQICGIFNVVIESTGRVISERRNQLLQQLNMQSHAFQTEQQGFEEAISLMHSYNQDVPFALLYRYDAASASYSLSQSTALAHHQIPELRGCLNEVVTSGHAILFPQSLQEQSELQQMAEQQLRLMPLLNAERQVIGILVTAINEGIPYLKPYEDFLDTVAYHVGVSIHNGAKFEREKITSDRIKYSEDQLQFAIDAAELATWDLDPLTNRFSGNNRVKAWFGLQADDEIDLSAAINVIAENDRLRVINAIQEAMNFYSGGNYDIEYTIINPADQLPRIVKAKGKSLFDANQQVVRFSGTLQDITKERDSLKKLEESNQRLEIALEAGKFGSYDLDLTTGEMQCTAQCKANFGLAPTAVFNFQELLAVILPEYRNHMQQQVERAIKDHTVYHSEYQIRWPDGSLHWISAFGKPRFNNAGKALQMVGVTYDISDQINSRLDLERAYEQGRLARQAAQLGTFDMDLINDTMEWDERCRLLFGISHRNEVSYEDDFLPGLHEDDRDRITEIIKKVLIKSETDGNYDVEYRTVGIEDQQLRWIKARGKAFFNEHEEPVRFIGSVLEITDQKQNEIRKNDFIGMVSHELKTPLTSLKAYVQLLNVRAKKQDDTFVITSLGKVELQVNKMSNLINGFLDVSRLESGKIYLNMNNFRLDELVAEIVEDIASVLVSHEIVLLPGPDLTVHADRDKIGQVINNLISNAVKYSPRGKLIEIGWRQLDGYAQLSVRDEGMGIRPQDKDKLFDRFYRVESAHTQHISGFGIGLYLSAEIIGRHGGQIWVESEKGVGSTFFFNLKLPEAS